MSKDELLTVDETAKTLRVSKMTIYRYINDNKLPAYKLEQEYRVRKSDLNLFLEARKSQLNK